MAFVSSAAHRPGEAAKAAPEPVPERERRTVPHPRNVQHSFIDSNTKVVGDLESVGDISLEGTVEGNVNCRTLTLRGRPVVTGEVQADAVHVCGRFRGTLRAKKVVLTKTARMSGNIYYEILVLHEGAKFEGDVRRTSAPSPKPAASAGTEAPSRRYPARPGLARLRDAPAGLRPVAAHKSRTDLSVPR